MSQTSAAAWIADAARSAGDAIAMLQAVVADPRVSQKAKVEAGAALGYLLAGRGRIPSFIPVVGRLDDVSVAAFALRRLLGSAGEPVLRAHWRGSERGLEMLLTMTGAFAAPGGRLRRLAVMSAAATIARDRISGVPRTGSRRPGLGKVVDGEVLARSEERR